ncbi:hypothetical protein P280DRAFT_399270 [Massarina eburnea CBS 473.64]|uniref:SEC7 domain-containing protein n=1 Tax=Massarina eburnea CBS 473.64 TaxID=1395130 RepID=A0A6A6S0B1_9PLEO|nr:hypothetical protein P280DRAFT_399270 [Massarina eburnea CBS 473.64]
MADFGSSSSSSNNNERPTTPPGPSGTYRSNGGMRALDTHLHTPETFYHDATPIDGNSAHEGKERNSLRDSHDLSFVDGTRTRDSVVDNMLLSLDQFSQPSYSKFSDDFFADTSFETRPTRQRGHTYTSSQSSDYDAHVDDTAERFSAHHSHSQPRSRRSNSDNNIPHSRKGSLRGGAGWPSSKQTADDYQQNRHMRGGGRKGSKGSANSSMDIGHGMVIGSHAFGFGRSASFDHGNKASRSPVKTESILDRSKHTYQAYNAYDAAPEPTIPAGPRRHGPPQSPIAYPSQPTYVPPQEPVPRRKNSIRSTTSYKTLRKLKSQPNPSMRDQAQEFVNASHLRDLPPLPTFQDPPAPSPTVATRKLSIPPASPAPAPPVKDNKPGFFRRVFGGALPKPQAQLSNSSVTTTSSRSHVEASPASSSPRPAEIEPMYSPARPQTTSNSGPSHIASQLKSPAPKMPQSATSMQDLNQQPQPQPQPPTLAKKGSSFFRRRKKSVTEPPKVPAMALEYQAPPNAEIPPPQLIQQSPAFSSLRMDMDPYLHNTDGVGQQHREPRERSASEANGERPNGFSPGYKPHKDATVRSIKPGSSDADIEPPVSRAELFKAHLASNDSPKLKLKIKRGRTEVVQEDTFLADSSSCNEDRSGRATPAGDSAFYDLGETGRDASPAGSSNAHPDSGEKRDLLSPRPGDAKATPAASPSQSASEVEDDGWVLTTPSKPEQASSKKPAGRSKRVWLEPTSSEENLAHDDADDLALPLEGPRSILKESPTMLVTSPTSSIHDDFLHSSTSLPTVQVDGRETESSMPAIIEHCPQPTEPTDEDRERALRIFSGDDPSTPIGEAATLLGNVTPASTRLRIAFMALFHWSGFNVLGAMRDLCGKIVLKAETQQVDRILMSLSERWCECNPNHGFKAVDVVHTICYSILLLNTDLHVADIESRMTRNQFVKNTLPTVSRVCKDAVRDAEETLRPDSTHMRGSIPSNDKSDPSSPAVEDNTYGVDVADEPLDNRRARSRLSLRPPFRSGSEGMSADALSDINLLVHAPYNGLMKGWENQVEIVLKEFYDSIRKTRLPLHNAPKPEIHEQPSSNSLSVGGMLRRTPSVLSKSPSDHTNYRTRSQTDFRTMGKSWNSRTRSRPRLYPTSTGHSSRTSLDDQSVWSPAGSSTWSKYSYGKTHTSMSVETLGSHFAHGDYQQAIGFANALSQAIIREEGMSIASDEEFTRVAPLLEDETLELVGAPWAKEGIVKHKHHLEALDKKSKDRTWSECFAVIEKGYLRLFSFNMNSKSMRNKNKSRPSTGGVVGGGNWMDNAEALDNILLRQTIASALPPPGYSKSRPNVFALSLPTGAVHLFQVGTPDIVREFVTTSNYWSARLSKEPLMGGVSNIEHGWGDNVINTALIRPASNASNHGHGHMRRPSMASSMRSSMDHGSGVVKARLQGDKATLSDWRPPVQSMMASNLMEVDQLRALTDYVKNVEDELTRHNDLRAPMLIAFSPRHPNAAKAMANWERKSAYLLREIVKFRTYIDSLTAAQAAKDRIYAQRALDEENSLEAGTDAHALEASPEKETDDGAIELPQEEEEEEEEEEEAPPITSA